MTLDGRFCLMAGELVWVTIPFFLVAMAFRIYRWLRVPRSAVKLGIFDQQELRWLKLGKDSFLFPQVLDLDRWMWFFVIVFHLAGVLLFIGHLRLIFEFTTLANALGDGGMARFAFVAGGAVGIVLLVAGLYFLGRRLTPPGRSLSTAGDYFLLVLVLLVVLSGTHMRLFGHVPVTVYREYVNGLIGFGPYLPAGLETAAARWSLGIHLLLANVLIFYFPLSKLVHVIGSLTTNLIRSEHLGSQRN